MKYIATLLLLFKALLCYPQADSSGNPVFNSVVVSVENIKDFKLVSSYYTLKNNIEKKWSSVFISHHPTPGEVERAATELMSESFIMVRHHAMICVIGVMCSPWQFVAIDVVTGQQDMLPSPLKGDITENRAREIVKNQYDPKAKIENGRLYFNGKTFAIVTNEEIKQAVLNLIDSEHLGTEDSSGTIYQFEDDIKDTVLAQSKQGGKLDFFTSIAGHENDGILLKPGVYATRLHVALYHWGAACFDLGVNTAEDALAIYAEYKKHPADKKEEAYIRMGFGKELED
jgi:hypothetical protein